MRILSQDGKQDFPYEHLAIGIKYLGVFGDGKERFCIHCVNETMFPNDGVIAIYLSEQKAIKAMEMLHKEFEDFGKNGLFRFPFDD